MQTNTMKILFAVIIGIILVNLLFNLFGANKGLKDAIRNLESTQRHIDSAFVQLRQADDRLDSIKAALDTQRILINNIHVRTELMDLEKRLRDEKSLVRIDSLKVRIRLLKDYHPVDEVVIITEDLKN